jgi:undecaprenyl-diphosphatase
LRRSAAILAVLGTLLVAVPGVVYADGTEPSRLDRWIQSVVENTPSAAGTATLTVDWTGGPVGRTIMVLAVTALCLISGRRRLAATAVVGTILASVLATILKDVVGRRIDDEFLAYPSGHTAAATAISVVMGLLLADLLRVGRVLGASMVLGLAAGVSGPQAYSGRRVVPAARPSTIAAPPRRAPSGRRRRPRRPRRRSGRCPARSGHC